MLVSCEKNNSSSRLYVEGNGVVDIEGNEYKTVIIGDQEWMAENLKTDLYSNGDSIPYSGADIRAKVYDNNPENEKLFGKLYNYEAVLDTSGVCPCGWHVASELEYAVLIDYLGGLYDAMEKMKSSWISSPNGVSWIEVNESGNVYRGNNFSGYNALPGGRAGSSTFSNMDTLAVFWAQALDNSESVMIRIGNNPYVEKQTLLNSFMQENSYHSIRCIKDL